MRMPLLASAPFGQPPIIELKYAVGTHISAINDTKSITPITDIFIPNSK